MNIRSIARSRGRIGWPAFDKWVGPTSSGQGSRSARSSPPADGLDQLPLARRGLVKQASKERGRYLCHNDGGDSVTSLALRPFLWRSCGSRSHVPNTKYRRCGCAARQSLMRPASSLHWSAGAGGRALSRLGPGTPRGSSAMFHLRVRKRVVCTRAAPLFVLRYSFADGLSADYHKFGNDGQSEESGLSATAPTTGKPCDIIEPST